MPRLARALVAVALVLAGATVPFLAASAPKVVLDWSSPATGCPSRTEVEAEIATLLASSSASEVRAEIRIDETAAGVRARVVTTIEGKQGQRVLEAATCGEAAHAAALVVALAVDPFATSAPSASASGSASASAVASVSAAPSVSAPSASVAPVLAPTAAPPMPVARRPRRRTPHVDMALWVGGGPLLDTAALPGGAIGLSAQLGIELDALRLAAAFTALPSRRDTVDDSAKGGRFSLYAGSLNGCVRILTWLAPCAAVEVGRIGAEGFGVRAPGSGAATWFAASGGFAAMLRRGAWGVRLEGWVVVPVARPEFVLNAVGVVHTPGIGARGVLLFEVAIL